MRTGILSLASLASIFTLSIGLLIGCGAKDVAAFSSNKEPVDEDGMGGLGDDADGGKKPSSNKGCSNNQVEIARTPVVIEFVIDESTSMNSDGKWKAATEALAAAFEQMGLNPDPATFVGTMFYGDSLGDKVAPAPLTDTSHYDELLDFVDVPTATGSATKTAMALGAAYKLVQRWTPPKSTGLSPDNIKRVVILLSDGQPTDSRPDCIDQAQEAFDDQDKPVLTFSVGIGPFPSSSGYDPKFMGEIAVAGGTAPAGCDSSSQDLSTVCHYQITPGDDVTATKAALVAALDSIRALSASCEYSFTTDETTDLSKVKVTVTDGDKKEHNIPKDPENGWSFDDPNNPTKIILNGDSCSNTNATMSGRVDIVIACKSAS